MTTTTRFDSVPDAIAAIAAGRPIVVADDESRENEGDLILAADAATPQWLGFIVRHTSGVVCAPAEGAWLDRLGIGPMTATNGESMRTAFTVTVDAATGVGTGISAADRTRTLHTLADPAAEPSDLVRPGHVFPLRSRPGGVLERPGHTEAAVDLMRLANRQPVGVLAELVHDDGRMQHGQDLRAFADEHGLVLISVADLIRYRRRTERVVEQVTSSRIPTRHGEFTAYAYRSETDGGEHVALVLGDVTDADAMPLTRLHSECLTGDVFGSLRCDCGQQLDAAMAAVAEAGCGVIIYLRGHEGRGIGLAAKLEAYTLQDSGFDTVEANLALGLPADAREYWIAAQILADLQVPRVRLLTNNPAKQAGLEEYGVTVRACVPLVVGANSENRRYLDTKRDRLGHLLPR